MILNQMVKEWRKAHRVSTRKLAKKIGITHCAVFRFECGKEVTARQWVAIVKWAFTSK